MSGGSRTAWRGACAAPPILARRPLVSVITPVRNAAETLAETVASIRAQSMEDWEAWLADDASTDGSWRLMRALAAQDRRIRLIRRARQGGAAAARNAGIRAASGRHIAFLDADDLWLEQKLARQVDALSGGAGFVHSSYLRRAPGRPDRVIPAPALLDHAGALRANQIGCLTAIYDSDRFGKVEMPALPRRQDYALWLTLLQRGGPAVGLPEVLAEYRVRPGSLSANKLAAATATWIVLRRHQKLPLGTALSCLSSYALRAIRQRR